jgi:hypothetical protein
MKRIRGTLKKIVLKLFWPVYRQLQHEMHVEFNRLSQSQADFHNHLVQQVSDQLIKMHHLVDDLKQNRSEQQINTALTELTKIRESIDRLRLDRYEK